MELPKRFPEYSIMYKTLSKKITEFEEKRKLANQQENQKIQRMIKNYELEREKIRGMFPENFFED